MIIPIRGTYPYRGGAVPHIGVGLSKNFALRGF
jgi:hypothetical protein